ncbi:hypothetical protein GCM10007875_13740 [Limnobacter litoralis]|uniref:Phosphoribosyltransferase domain-containing protein n=2 Tax=Limnobacter litoralis TaxID=481366 RepID=A0ABQ5YNV4_9BURK|nr:hypothetical protein GCM10007875_13740 [Limnobacter litoralis]
MHFPPRYPWSNFPPVSIHSPESAVKKHPLYNASKSGDPEAAFRLVSELVSPSVTKSLIDRYATELPILVSAHALESSGVNAIPAALAELLEEKTGFESDTDVVQTNVVSHTGASGIHRIAHQAMFTGTIIRNRNYLLVDDFVGQGGTLANLRGYILDKGGRVVAATVLTGKPYSATICLESQTLQRLRDKHGKNLESWWPDKFGHSLDCLTESEARYLEKIESFESIRYRIAQAEQS